MIRRTSTHLPESVLVARLRELRDLQPERVRHRRAWAWVRELLWLLQKQARRMRLPADAVHDAAIALHARAHDGRLSADGVLRPEPWLRQVVRRTLRGVSRRERRYEGRFDRGADVESMASTEAASAMCEGETLPVLLSRVGPVERLVLLSTEAPHLVEETDVSAAVAASQPPRIGLTRGAGPTMRGIERWRARPGREPRDLHFVLRGPPELDHIEAWSEDDAIRARDWIYKRVQVARDNLRRSTRRSEPVKRVVGSPPSDQATPRRRGEPRPPRRSGRR